MTDRFIESLTPSRHAYPQERGIVIAGGGLKYFPSVWVNVNLIRRFECELPIQLWYMGDNECDPYMKRLLAPLGVECVDARKFEREHPCRILCGWELKPYAALHSPFAEVLFLDADNGVVRDPEGGLSALGFAALYNHYDVFAMKRIQLLPDHPAMRDILRYSCDGRGTEIVERLLATGMNPNDRENGGCSAIQDLISRLEWGGSSHVFSWELKPSGIDTERTRDYLKVIHLLVKHGGRWAPEGSSEINSARRSLLKMTPDYTVEFVWIMAKYQACSKEHVEALLRTPTIKRHTSKHRQRLAELVKAWEIRDMAEDEAMPTPSRVDPGNRSYASQR